MSVILYRWISGAMVPLSSFRRRCAKRFIEGGRYRLEEIQERSTKSHDHFFAVVDDAYANLPEDIAVDFKSPDHLRYWCLIKTGFVNETIHPAESYEEAHRVAATLRSTNEKSRVFAIIKIDGNKVYHWTAESQSKKLMGANRFQQSKQAVLNELASLLEVSIETLISNAGQAA